MDNIGYIIGLIILTIVLIGSIVILYYWNQISNGNTLSSSELNGVLGLSAVIVIIAFIIWIYALYALVEDNGGYYHHHDATTIL